MILCPRIELDAHPILLTFAETAAASFPLILVIGREPNTAQRIADVRGPYDFRWNKSRCGFWNTSYGMVARVVGIPTWRLKQSCIARNGSPIVYADALPIGIPNRITNKQDFRATVAEAAIPHIANVFSHQTVIARVALVATSGLYDAIFDPAKGAIEEECRERHIPILHLPFFHGVNARKIQNALDEASRARIREIVRQFAPDLLK